MTETFERYHPDMKTLHRGFQIGPCFVCQIIAKNAHPAYVVYEDESTIAFLDKYPRQYGYTLVAPKEHLEQVTSDLSIERYLELQRLIYNLSEAIRAETNAERMYIFTFGSNQGNAHVHWHIAPLPPETPYEEQQMAAVSWRKGVLKIPEDEMIDLAARLKSRLERRPL